MILLMARKHYTDEFRRQAVDLFESTEGATFKGIAEDLGIARGTLAQWVSVLGTGTTTAPTGPATASNSGSPPGRVESQSRQARAARGASQGAGGGEGQALHRTGDLEVGGEVFAGETNW